MHTLCIYFEDVEVVGVGWSRHLGLLLRDGIGAALSGCGGCTVGDEYERIREFHSADAREFG